MDQLRVRARGESREGGRCVSQLHCVDINNPRRWDTVSLAFPENLPFSEKFFLHEFRNSVGSALPPSGQLGALARSYSNNCRKHRRCCGEQNTPLNGRDGSWSWQKGIDEENSVYDWGRNYVLKQFPIFFFLIQVILCSTFFLCLC